ncbi:integral membrane protein [Bifidobacterium hapali]|uniref:Integral membrane protein n=1 Tax=Bifidobacterium hapali TaxID=1630172 RepID=A0A261G0K5_9BIFI|nr:MptD family putative ECF transporter S component [Bifidobacterium hapali]OZG64693.1 integral membrane protein [Bifidobacterium hapali]
MTQSSTPTTSQQPSSPKRSLGLKPKDWISVGVYAVIYMVLSFAVAMLGYIPVLMPFSGVFIGIVCQTPVMLMALKVRHAGVFTVFGIITALLMGPGQIPTMVCSVVVGILADLICHFGGFTNRNLLIVAVGVFNIWSCGKYIPFFFTRDAYLAQLAKGYGQSYVDQVSGLFPMWMAWLMPVLLFVSGVIGGWIASKLLSKHFEKAGLV